MADRRPEAPADYEKKKEVKKKSLSVIGLGKLLRKRKSKKQELLDQL